MSSHAVAPQAGSVEQAALQQKPPKQAPLEHASSSVLVLVAAQVAPAPPLGTQVPALQYEPVAQPLLSVQPPLVPPLPDELAAPVELAVPVVPPAAEPVAPALETPPAVELALPVVPPPLEDAAALLVPDEEFPPPVEVSPPLLAFAWVPVEPPLWPPLWWPPVVVSPPLPVVPPPVCDGPVVVPPPEVAPVELAPPLPWLQTQGPYVPSCWHTCSLGIPPGQVQACV